MKQGSEPKTGKARSRRNKSKKSPTEQTEKDEAMSGSGSGIQINRQAVLVGVVVIAAAVYGVYYLLPQLAAKQTFNHVKVHDTWKTGPFGAVDSSVLEAMKNVKTTDHDHVIEFSVGDKKVKVFYREATPVKAEPSYAPIVLLHGSGDSSKWWENVGTFGLAAAAGHRVIGIDLPGWGMTETLEVEDRGKFLAAFLQEVQVHKPILIPISMGGSYAIPYLMTPSGVTCEDRASGFVPIATVGSDMYTPAQYHRCHVPTMIVYGTKDTKLGLGSAGDLRNLASNEIFPMEKAGHACVREKPDEWHMFLYNFLKQIRK